MNPVGIGIRRARPADLDAVVRVFSRAQRALTFMPELHSAAEDKAFWREQMFVRAEVFVAEAGGSIVGVSALDDDYIGQLQVDPSHWGRGIGTGLVENAKALRDNLQVWTFQQNVRARALYERHGFVAVDFTDGANNEEKLPDVRYEWRR